MYNISFQHIVLFYQILKKKLYIYIPQVFLQTK